MPSRQIDRPSDRPLQSVGEQFHNCSITSVFRNSAYGHIRTFLPLGVGSSQDQAQRRGQRPAGHSPPLRRLASHFSRTTSSPQDEQTTTLRHSHGQLYGYPSQEASDQFQASDTKDVRSNGGELHHSSQSNITAESLVVREEGLSS
jgi:hypothetical protein